jgi:hypothetical protein
MSTSPATKQFWPKLQARSDDRAFRDVAEMPDLGSRSDFGAFVHAGRAMREEVHFPRQLSSRSRQ